MKTTSLRIIGALVVLSALWFVPSVRADDGTGYVNEINGYVDQIYQDQKQTDDYVNSIWDQTNQIQNQSDDSLDSIGQNAQPAAQMAIPQPQPLAAGPVAVPPAGPFMIPAQAVPQQFPIPLDAQEVFAFQQRVRQQIMQTQQQVTQMQKQQMMRVQQ